MSGTRIGAIPSVRRGGVFYSASQDESASKDTETCKSSQECLDCRAEALIPALFQSTIERCKAILKSSSFASRNASCASPMHRSDSSSNVVQSKLLAFPDLEQVLDQRKAELDKETMTKHETGAKDTEVVGRQTKEEAKQERQARASRHTFPTKLRKGCTTCEAHRITCDGGKPKCRNCTEFGRECEGYGFSPKNDIDTSASVLAANARSKHGSVDDNPREDSLPALEPSLPTQTASDISSRTGRQPSRSDQSSETIHEKNRSGLITIEDLQHPHLHVSVNSFITDTAKSDLITGGDASVEDVISDVSQDALSSMSRPFSSTAYNIGLGRRLLEVVTSLLLLEDAIRPETVSVIAKCDPDLYEVVVNLLLECASQLCELGGSVGCESLDMMELVDLIEEVPRFERTRPRSSQQRNEISQNGLLTKIERNVNLLMDLTTTVEDVVIDLDSHVMMPQQHTSTSCVRHVPTEHRTVTVQDPLLPASPSHQVRQPSMEPSQVLVDKQPDKDEASSLRSLTASIDPTLSQKHNFDTTGQIGPPGVKPRVTVILWEDEGTFCFQVEAMGVVICRREDNHFINGTNLLDIANRTQGKRARTFKSEKVQHLVSTGPAQLRGVWIPFDRALDFANSEMITENLYPLFVHYIRGLVDNPLNISPRSVAKIDGTKRVSFSAPSVPSILRTGTSPIDSMGSVTNQRRPAHVYGGIDAMLEEVPTDGGTSIWGITKAGRPHKRLTQPCLTCWERKIKCVPGNGTRCSHCVRFNRECKFDASKFKPRQAYARDRLRKFRLLVKSFDVLKSL